MKPPGAELAVQEHRPHLEAGQGPTHRPPWDTPKAVAGTSPDSWELQKVTLSFFSPLALSPPGCMSRICHQSPVYLDAEEQSSQDPGVHASSDFPALMSCECLGSTCPSSNVRATAPRAGTLAWHLLCTSLLQLHPKKCTADRCHHPTLLPWPRLHHETAGFSISPIFHLTPCKNQSPTRTSRTTPS